MAHVNFDRVHETTATTGIGALTLAGAVDASFRTFASVCSTSDTFFYTLVEAGVAWETGLGTYSGTNTLTRTSVRASSNGGSAINLGSGAKFVFMAPIASSILGKQAIWIPASAMVPRTTNGAAAGTAEMSTNKNMFATLDFDATTQEFAQFAWCMPSSWNEGTVTFVPVWSHPSTATNFGVVFQLAGVAISNDDAGDVAFGTAQTSTDTGGTTNDVYKGPESSAITIAGSPAAGDWVMYQVARVPANGSDTMAVDARLHGIVLFITTNEMVDS